MPAQIPSSLPVSPPAVQFSISRQDREILRPLAARLAQLAARPVEAEKRELWRRHNNLQSTSPLIFCDPENGWGEIIPESSLLCAGSLARAWEITLRREIFWGDSMRDDRPLEPFFNLRHVCAESDWGMHEVRIGGEHGGAYTWDAPLKSYDDFHKLHFPTIHVDADATRQLLELAQSTLGDLLHVRLKTRWWWTLGLTQTAANLRGLQQLMLDMYDFPDELHRLMAFLRDGTLAKLDFLQSQNLLASNHDASYVGSGGFGITDQLAPAARTTTAGMWGFCESQETVGIAPDMFAQFVYPYQLPLLQRFGLNCYGCCEPLHLRWHVIANTPGLRRVSVSPWADIRQMAEQLQDRFIFSWKPTPSDLAQPHIDEKRIRESIRRTLQQTRGCHLEIIMKDNHTLGGNPQNVIRWVQIAREEVRAAYPG